MKEWLEYAAVWVILKTLGILPRAAARGLACGVAREKGEVAIDEWRDIFPI